MRTSGDKPTNALTISQEASSPPSPVAFPDLGDANALANELELWNNSSEKKSSEKNKPKKPSKSGGGKHQFGRIAADEHWPTIEQGYEEEYQERFKEFKETAQKLGGGQVPVPVQKNVTQVHPRSDQKWTSRMRTWMRGKALKAAEAQSYARE